MPATKRLLSPVGCLLGAILPLVFAGGCVVGTREPLYDVNRDTAFDPGLLGTWHGPDGTIDIMRGPRRSYRSISARADPEAPPEELTYDLVTLGRKRYLFPHSPASGIGTPLFGSCQVRRVQGQLCVRPFDVAALADRLQRQPGTLRYEPAGLHTGVRANPPATGPAPPELKLQNLILTDSPKRIRQYLIRHENDRELFPTEIVLTRMKETHPRS